MNLPSVRRSYFPSAALIFALFVSACGTFGEEATPRDLSMACQTVPCQCSKPGGGLFSEAETSEILWSSDGSATCSEGFELERLDIED